VITVSITTNDGLSFSWPFEDDQSAGIAVITLVKQLLASIYPIDPRRELSIRVYELSMK